MRPALAILVLVALTCAGCGGKGKPKAASTTGPPPPALPQASVPPSEFKATLRAFTHRPRVGQPWRYLITATPSDSRGRPIISRVRVQLFAGGAPTADPADHTFTGAFQETIRWPASTRGRQLVLRAIVVQPGNRKVLNYWIRVR